MAKVLIGRVLGNVRVGGAKEGDENVEQDDDREERPGVVNDEAERRAKIFSRLVKVGRAEKRLEENVDDAPRVRELGVGRVEREHTLDKAERHDGEQKEEDEGLAEHPEDDDLHRSHNLPAVKDGDELEPEDCKKRSIVISNAGSVELNRD